MFGEDKMKNKLGDYQTPPELASAVVDRISTLGPWSRMIEPTCGRGGLIEAVLTKYQNIEIHGFDIQSSYVDHCKSIFPSTTTNIRNTNTLTVDYSALQWKSNGPLLVLANPPWVNVGRSRKRSRNSTMMDISTEIILRIVDYAMTLSVPVTFAILCKTSTSREILQSIPTPLSNAFTCGIDAFHYFKVKVDACLCVFVIDAKQPSIYRYPVFNSLSDTIPHHYQGWMMGLFINDLDAYSRFRNIDGVGHLQWYSGISKQLKQGDMKIILIRGTDVYSERVPNVELYVDGNIANHYLAPFKIVISCMHKNPVFRLYAGERLVPDDGCCFLPFFDEEEAKSCLLLLSLPICTEFLHSICFTNAKRPVTTALLQRIHFGELARSVVDDGKSTVLTKLRKIIS